LNTSAVQLARRFAEILDDRDYDVLNCLLSANCKYEFRGCVTPGSSRIIEHYRNATEWAFDVLDRIQFTSHVEAESHKSARITFTDRLFFGGSVHEYRCQQLVTVGDSGRIIHIRHVDLDGQTAALDTFFRECGIARPAADSPGIIGSDSGS
jgi:hypothetical protein